MDYEKLGLFYLGMRYDLAAGKRQPDLVLYDSKDLVTHAVCVGMTGSGKTGLGIAVIEEAALDNIPVLAIDPKGDLANLLLTFPDLKPEDFAPWVDASDARTRSMTTEAFAVQQAEAWKKGLAEWGEDGARIGRVKAAARVRVYTPGSCTGTPLALLNSLRSTPGESDEDALARTTSTAASLLSLAGFTDLPPHSREEAFLAAILGSPSAPSDLPGLVHAIQRPPFERVGVLDLETYYPAKERQELALRFNSVLATPGFEVWLTGAPLDLGSILFDESGRPRVAIVSIAHLADTERMLVVSLLLNAVLDWTRRQGGTGSLRALVYMDEVFGYLPPVANPPSKLPLLTLLKQARAYGVGLMLSTQNPVDLDYKALSNTGTWFLGKLQTERDKARVLDGLEGVAGGMDRQTLDRSLSALRSRVFLMHNVHDREPVVFETRWTLSYLRGPMGREELKRAIGSSTPVPHPADSKPSPVVESGVATRKPTVTDQEKLRRPALPTGVREFFLTGAGRPVRRWVPVLYGSARVNYADAKRGIDIVQDVQVMAPFVRGALPIDWDKAEATESRPEELLTEPPVAGDTSDTQFGELPTVALNVKKYSDWSRDFEQWILRGQRLSTFSAPSLRLTSKAGETERDFRIRMQQAAREARDARVQKLRESYTPRLSRLAERVRTAREGVAREQHQAEQQKTQTAVSLGATVLGAILGRKTVSLSTIGRATTTARGVSRSMKEAGDVARAQERLQEAEAELKTLETKLQNEIDQLAGADPTAERVETIEIKPKRGAIDVRLVALAWKPE